RRLAVGGMAEVFKGKLIGIKGFEKTLAVKRILPEFSEDEEFVQMFVDEARISSNLHHANIVQVFDFGKFESAYYIAMEFVDGPNLKNLVQRYLKERGMFPRNLTLYLLIQIARALDYAHGARIDGVEVLDLVHRDVSPQNVLVSRSGDVKITDFGIAKAAIKLSKTQPGKVQGKFSYMSPEQALGKPLDRRSDIFSLGIIAYELLSGIKVYGAEDTQRRYKEVREGRITRLGTIVRDLPSEIESLVMDMLSKDPADRPQTCGEIATKLSEFMTDISTTQLTAQLGQLVEELFPREKSSSEVNRRITALIEGGKVEGEADTDVSAHRMGPSAGEPGTRALAFGDEITQAGWPKILWHSRLGRVALLMILAAGLSWVWLHTRIPKPPPVVPPSAAPGGAVQPRSGPVDPDLRAAADAQEAQAKARISEMEEKLRAAETRASEKERELTQTEKKLKEALRAEAPPPPKACPSDMAVIPAGEFLFGSDRNDPDWNSLVEPPAARMPLGKFCVDRYEFPNRKAAVPKTAVTWTEAQLACTQVGKRLCTQEEWERACKGPGARVRNRRFPYGDTWDPSRCDTERKEPGSGELSDRKLAAAGTFPGCVTPEGVFDMSGNADEWTSSRGRFTTEARITHGGSFHHPGWRSRCSSLREVLQGTKDEDIGFRCCKDAL
ncbi:MAG: bifunctional serine/threonine-protein kinase/formylglycine-generating enzyme family protein, partial [Pseudomonadota bacterium]